MDITLENLLLQRTLCAGKAIREQVPSFKIPDAFVQSGTGLKNILNPPPGYKIHIVAKLKYGEIPGFPEITAEHHVPELVFADIWRDGDEENKKRVSVAKGKKHIYEHHDQHGQGLLDVCTIITTMALIGDEDGKTGIDKVIISSAAGGLDRNVEHLPYLMAVNSLYNRTGISVLTGPGEGPLFKFFSSFSGGYPFSPVTINLAKEIAKENDIPFREGALAMYHAAKRFETPIEVNDAIRAGCGAIGSSNVLEAEAYTAIMQHPLRANRTSWLFGLAAITNQGATEEFPLTTGHVANAGRILERKKYAQKLIYELILRSD